MNDIQVSARLKIKPGKMEDFRKLANSCVEVVKQKDKGTIQYDWFYNDQKSECIVIERYVDSEAGLDHIANVGELLGHSKLQTTQDHYGEIVQRRISLEISRLIKE